MGRQVHVENRNKAFANEDLVAITHYAKVVGRPRYRSDALSVVDVDNGNSFEIIGASLLDGLASADLYTKEEKMSKTNVAQILVKSFNTPFTVCFVKQKGEERVLRGRLVEPEPLLGRSHVEDLDVTDEHKLRLVDHRTIKWLIVNGTKYTVSK